MEDNTNQSVGQDQQETNQTSSNQDVTNAQFTQTPPVQQPVQSQQTYYSGTQYGNPNPSPQPIPQPVPQPQYTYVNNNYVNSNLEEPVSLGQWVGVLLLSAIPCVNIILLFVWAFSSSEKKSKSNYAKAVLIISGSVIALYIIAIIFIIAMGYSFGSFNRW